MRKALTVVLSFAAGFLLCHFTRPSPRGAGGPLDVGEVVTVAWPTGEVVTGAAGTGEAQPVTRTARLEVVRVHGDGGTRFGRKGEFVPWVVESRGVRYVLAPAE
jgi:hypothetical protein